jgi:hypothetical protein
MTPLYHATFHDTSEEFFEEKKGKLQQQDSYTSSSFRTFLRA